MTTMLDDTAQIKQATIDVENIYDEIEIDDMEWEEDTNMFRYPCPCGDKFQISLEQVFKNRASVEDRDKSIAICPSCSLQIKIIYDEDFLMEFIEENGLQDLIKDY